VVSESPLSPGEDISSDDGSGTEEDSRDQFSQNVWRWTNESLKKGGKKRCTKIEFNAYVGLDMGMPLMKFNIIPKYWSSGCFLSHDTFCSTMSRVCFKQIHSCVCFSSPSFYDADKAYSDLLWTCQKLLDNFIKKCADVAVPVGVSALDECTCAMKCTRAKTYIPIKPDKYGIHFYAVVGHRYCYKFSFFDNRASNNTGISGLMEYHRIFRDMSTPYYKTIEEHESIRDSPSALWLLMMGHQTKTHKQPDGKKRIFYR
jgi:hypothetical protein